MPACVIPTGVADRLLGPDELALIADHPISKALDRDFQEAIHDPDVFGFAWLMLNAFTSSDCASQYSARSLLVMRSPALDRSVDRLLSDCFKCLHKNSRREDQVLTNA
ncbi:MAG TPA: hypothetical protein VIX37_07235 [Candidatus Sulfotelmatobacter sp.]